jgi:coatomer subunit beta
VYSSTAAARLEAVKAAAKPPLRGESRAYTLDSPDEYWLLALLLSGDFYTGGVLASTLTKLLLRFAESSQDNSLLNSLRAEVQSFYSQSVLF